MRQRAFAVMILCYVLWGGGMIAMKFALQSFGVVQIIAIRVLVPAILYLALWRKWAHCGVRQGDWKFLLLLVLCEPCLFFFCITLAMRFTSASEGGIISATLPLVTALGAWLFFGEKMSGRAITGMLLALAGICGMNAFSARGGTASMPLLGNAIMFLGVIFSAGYTLCARRLAKTYSSLFISAIQAIGGSIVFLPISLCQPLPDRLYPAAIGGLCYLGFCIGLGVYFSFNWAMRWLNANVAGLLGNITPLCTLFFAWLILGEQLGGGQLGCMALAMCGIALACARQG